MIGLASHDRTRTLLDLNTQRLRQPVAPVLLTAQQQSRSIPLRDQDRRSTYVSAGPIKESETIDKSY